MDQSPNTGLADLHEIISNQRALGKRIIWLFISPVVISAALAAMFFILVNRITGVEVLAKRLVIEKYLEEDNNYTMAIDQYEQIAKTQETADVLARLGNLYFRVDPKKNEKIALQKLEAAQRLDPKYWVIYTNLTYIYAYTGKNKNAIEVGQKALQLNQFDAKTLNNLAWIYATSKEPAIRNLQLAQQYAEKAHYLTREKQPEVLDTLAEIYFQKGGEGDRDRALNFLRRAIVLAPKGDVMYHERLKALFPNEKL